MTKKNLTKLACLVLAVVMVLVSFASCTKEIKIDAGVIYDQHDIKLSTKEYSLASTGASMTFEIENNSDKDLLIGCEGFYINGYKIDNSIYLTVKKGKKTEFGSTLYTSELNKIGLDADEVSEISLILTFSDNSSKEILFKTDMINIKTSEYDNYKRLDNTTDYKLYAGNGLDVSAVSLNLDNANRLQFKTCVCNNSEQNLIVGLSNLRINGVKVDSEEGTVVAPGYNSIEKIYVNKSDMAYVGISKPSEVESMSFNLILMDPKTYKTVYSSDTIDLDFSKIEVSDDKE